MVFYLQIQRIAAMIPMVQPATTVVMPQAQPQTTVVVTGGHKKKKGDCPQCKVNHSV